MPSSDNGRFGSVHHAHRKAHDRIKKLALNGGPYSFTDMAVLIEHKRVAMQCGFQRWQLDQYEAEVNALIKQPSRSE